MPQRKPDAELIEEMENALVNAYELLQGGPALYGELGRDETWLADRRAFLDYVATIVNMTWQGAKVYGPHGNPEPE